MKNDHLFFLRIICLGFAVCICHPAGHSCAAAQITHPTQMMDGETPSPRELIVAQAQSRRIQRQLIIILTSSIPLILLSALVYTLRRTQKRLVRQQAELERANANKDRFFSIIAHDLRHPFQTLSSYIRLMEKHAADFTPSEIVEMTRDLKEGVAITADLLENLLEWSQCQTGTLHFQRNNHYLGPMVDRVLQQAYSMANAKGVLLASAIENPIKIYADRQMVEAVLRNLISNAIKFTHSGGEVVVCAAESEKWLELEIRDTGVGMNSMTMKNLFQIDKRVSTRGTENERGTGLGLVLCKEFVDLHGGEIKIQSEPGQGTHFIVTFPTEKS